MYIIFDHVEVVNQHIRTFWFRALPKPNYIAGQFVELTVPHNNADQRGIRRWFTLSSSPSEDYLSITTKLNADTSSTFKQALESLKPKAKVMISEPMGDFVLPMDSNRPLLFIAGGIGITPVRSIVKWLSDTSQRRQFQIIYGVRSLSDAVFMDIFESYGVHTDIVVSDPVANWRGPKGHISVHLIRQLANINPETLVYVSGPERFVETLETALLNTGLNPDNFIPDFYHGYSAT